MTNKEILSREVGKIGYTLGCYDTDLETISKHALKKVIDNIDQEYTDVEISVNRKKYIVEIATVDNEKDFSLISKRDYINKYGNNK